MRVLVTGATGFVGRALVQDLARRGYHVVAGVRASRTAPIHPRMGSWRGLPAQWPCPSSQRLSMPAPLSTVWTA